MVVPYESLYRKVQIVLQSKLEEFQLYQYDAITSEQLWMYCVEKKWRKQVIEELPLHVVVSAVFSVTPSEILNYAQVKDLRSINGIIELSTEELDELKKKKKSK